MFVRRHTHRLQMRISWLERCHDLRSWAHNHPGSSLLAGCVRWVRGIRALSSLEQAKMSLRTCAALHKFNLSARLLAQVPAPPGR